MDRSRVVLAEIVRPRGTRGELLALSQTDIPNRFSNLGDGWVRFANGRDRAVRIENAWPHKGLWVLKFEGVDTIDDAEAFRAADLWVEPERRAALELGSFFQSDLIGCKVVDAASGETVGTVEGWQNYGAGPLMEVAREGRDLLIPFAQPLCREVDLEGRRVIMDLPAGLVDL